MGFNGRPVAQHAQHTLAFQFAIVGKLSLCLTVSNFVGAIAGDIATGLLHASDHRRQRNGDLSGAHLRIGRRAGRAALLRHAGFVLASLRDALAQIAVPEQRVHRQVKMSIDQ